MATLKRALGRWDLTAIGVNQVIGGSIFLLPSQVAIIFGTWSAIAGAAMGLVSMSVALCFAVAVWIGWLPRPREEPRPRPGRGCAATCGTCRLGAPRWLG